MIPLIVLLGSEIFAIALLLSRGDSGFLQIILFSQLWLVVVAIPFALRCETRLTFFKSRGLQVATLGLIVAAFWGLQVKIQDLPVASYAGTGQALAGPLSEFLPVVGVIVCAIVLLAGVILREER